jgi:hypothetical protein
VPDFSQKNRAAPNDFSAKNQACAVGQKSLGGLRLMVYDTGYEHERHHLHLLHLLTSRRAGRSFRFSTKPKTSVPQG